MMAPLCAVLMEWRLACGRPDADALVFPRADGEQWTDDDLRNRRNRVFKPAAIAAGLTGPVRPYDLRHAAASLWIHEGRTPVEVARLGHAPSVALDTYTHVFEELGDGPPVSAEEAIRAAREARNVPSAFPAAAGSGGA